MTLRLLTTLTLLLLAAACGTDDHARTPAGDVAARTAAGPPPSPAPAPSTAATVVELAAGATSVRGTLEDTPAGRDFAALLPLTLTVSDFYATEKISDLPRPVSTDGAPAGTTPSAGDISFYAPWGNLALFYRDFSYSTGLVQLGRLDPAGVELLAALDDGTTITISRHGGTP